MSLDWRQHELEATRTAAAFSAVISAPAASSARRGVAAVHPPESQPPVAAGTPFPSLATPSPAGSDDFPKRISPVSHPQHRPPFPTAVRRCAPMRTATPAPARARDSRRRRASNPWAVFIAWHFLSSAAAPPLQAPTFPRGLLSGGLPEGLCPCPDSTRIAAAYFASSWIRPARLREDSDLSPAGRRST